MCHDTKSGRRFFFHCWHDDERLFVKKRNVDCREVEFLYLGIGCPRHCCRCGKKSMQIIPFHQFSCASLRNIEKEIVL
jgi:hypothetical protein